MAAIVGDDILNRLPWILACQEDSYLTTFDAKVECCKPLEEWVRSYPGHTNGDSSDAGKAGKKRQKKKGNSAASVVTQPQLFGVVLNNTIFFPTGGGQPHDTGFLCFEDRKVRVVDVRRYGPEGKIVLHYCEEEIPTSVGVRCEIDTARRTDHMCHHTGQHLITAIAVKEYGWKTLSWCLNPDERPCYLDLDVREISEHDLRCLETRVNDQILKNVRITPSLMDKATFDEGSKSDDVRAHSKGINAGVGMPMRIVAIEGIENNACCGTHLQFTGHLQVISLLWTEKGKDEGSTRLWFMAGRRAIRRLNALTETSRKLTSILTCPCESHCDRVVEMLDTHRESNRREKSLLKTVASLSSNLAHHPEIEDGILYYHLNVGNVDFMKSCLREMKESIAATCSGGDNDAAKRLVYFVSVGTALQPGAFVLEGDEQLVPLVAKAVTKFLGKTRGGGKGSKFQAKVDVGVFDEAKVLSMQKIARAVVKEAIEGEEY